MSKAKVKKPAVRKKAKPPTESGQFKCRENAIALTHCEDALMWLQKRTRDRLTRGVEGTNQQ